MWTELQAGDAIDELDSDDRDEAGTAHDDTNKGDEDGKAVTDTDDRWAESTIGTNQTVSHTLELLGMQEYQKVFWPYNTRVF